MFKDHSHDFGDVQKGDIPEFRFEIENVYQEDIHITSVKSSCGCTSVSLSTNVLKTWEKGEIVCRFNSPAFNGAKKATITVRLAHPFVAEVQLVVKGNIVQGLNIKPRTIEFGQVSENSLPAIAIQMNHTGTRNFRIVDVKSTFPHIKVQLQQSQQRLGVGYTMTAQLKPSVPLGFTQGELYVVVEENRVRREIPVKFSAKVVSLLQYPDMITLDPVAPGEEVRKKFVLKADNPFRITDVTSPSEAFRVKAGKEFKKVHFVEVIYTGELDKIGRHECELNIFTDLGGSISSKIKAAVEVTSPPDEEPEPEIDSHASIENP